MPEKKDESCVLFTKFSGLIDFVLARLYLVKIENHLMWMCKVPFGRSVVITDHWVCLWIFLGSSNGFPLSTHLCILDYR
jgi:hypothetical protein